METATSATNVIIGDTNEALFIASFIMSILSASKGLATFLKDGPCLLLPKEGYYGGFVLLFFNICLTLVGKGMGLACILVPKNAINEYLTFTNVVKDLYKKSVVISTWFHLYSNHNYIFRTMWSSEYWYGYHSAFCQVL